MSYETDIVEQARQHAASFEAVAGSTVAFPVSVRFARFIVLQAEELKRLRALQPPPQVEKALKGELP